MYVFVKHHIIGMIYANIIINLAYVVNDTKISIAANNVHGKKR
ncbi:hypothetical protein BMS3Abin11_00555 [bacterium BMS3Abin11]|nr:hypothetical protein BMS3Abin11_00555 [bacterium BMS3Abin11]